MKTVVFVVGERCSGTNLLQQYLQQRFSNSVVDDCLYGYKHWPHFQDVSPQNAAEIVVVVIVRHFLDWTRSLSTRCWNLPHLKKGGLDALLTQTPWFSYKEFSKHERIACDSKLPYGTMYRDVFDLRSSKHAFWREALASKGVRHMFVRYEDLIGDTEAMLSAIGTRLNLTPVSEDQRLELKNNIHSYGNSKTPFDAKTHEKKQLFFKTQGQQRAFFSDKQWALIRNKLDRVQESKLGYGDAQQETQAVQQTEFNNNTARCCYVWNTAVWVGKNHYIKEEEVKRWNVFGANVVDIVDAKSFTTFTHVIIDSTSLPICTVSPIKDNAATFEHAIKNSNAKIIIDVHDMHEKTFRGGLAALCSYAKSIRATMLLIKAESDGEEALKVRRLFSSPVIHVPFGVPEQMIPVPPVEALIKEWADPELFNLKKQHDILSYGSCGKFYPLRAKFQTFMQQLRTEKNVNIHIIAGTGPNKQSAQVPTKAQLYKRIRQSWITVCTPSSFNYCVLKYWEAVAGGSVVWGPTPKSFPLLTLDRRTKNHLYHALRHKKKLSTMIRENYKRVALHHTLTHRILQTIAIVTHQPDLPPFADLVATWVSAKKHMYTS